MQDRVHTKHLIQTEYAFYIIHYYSYIGTQIVRQVLIFHFNFKHIYNLETYIYICILERTAPWFINGVHTHVEHDQRTIKLSSTASTTTFYIKQVAREEADKNKILVTVYKSTVTAK